jgi:pimeloyl-ACP methyl ester carboxylesterase
MKKSTKNLLFLTSAVIAGMHIYNRVVDSNAERKNALKVDNGHYYKWKEGNIFYTKTGTGEPILLIHDTDSGASGEEWAKVAKKLAKNNTVYTIDLLGCGRSDKPSIQYTSYMYVQIITAFVNDVIGKPVNVAATNLSTAPVIMANALSKNLFNKIILINPVSLQQLSCIPDKSTKFKQNIINLPIIGTFIYNKLMSPIKVDLLFRNKFISRSQLISDKMKDAYYESAHKGQSRGKYLYSSILSNYINTNIAPALKNLDKDVSIIASTGIKNNMDVINNYHKLNSKCDIIHIANAKLYPQLELPDKTASIIKKLLPTDFDYNTISGLRIEAQQKLNEFQPLSIGQASRISGVTPADISVLLVFLEQLKYSNPDLFSRLNPDNTSVEQ